MDCFFDVLLSPSSIFFCSRYNLLAGRMWKSFFLRERLLCRLKKGWLELRDWLKKWPVPVLNHPQLLLFFTVFTKNKLHNWIVNYIYSRRNSSAKTMITHKKYTEPGFDNKFILTWIGLQMSWKNFSLCWNSAKRNRLIFPTKFNPRLVSNKSFHESLNRKKSKTLFLLLIVVVLALR